MVLITKCRKCDIFSENDHECYANFKGSFKEMEAFALVQMHIKAYNDMNLWYREVVSDDDSTMKSCLKHQYKDLIAARLMDKKDWPVTKMVTKKLTIKKFF